MKTCGIIYVNKTYADGRIKQHLDQLAEMVVKVNLTVTMLRNGKDTVIRFNLFEAVKLNK